MRSWVNSKRFLTLLVSGLSTAVYDAQQYSCDDERPICSEIDVKIDVEKSPSLFLLRVTVSTITVHLRYREWVSLLTVLRMNVGRKLDRSSWDNLEVAWEHGDPVEAVSVEPTPRYSKEVSYSENARLVRFGKTKRPPSGTEKPQVLEIDVKLECERLSVLLHRDKIEESTGRGYDVALLIVRRLVSSGMRSEGGLQSASVSLGELFLFDLGGHSRRNQQSNITEDSWTLAHTVMVEGYADCGSGDSFDSQIVLNVDRSGSTTSDVSVSLLMNYISVSALVKPVEEILQFLMCQWETSSSGNPRNPDLLENPAEVSSLGVDATESESTSILQVKLVLHYPRFVFVADETDKSSRALVLEG